MSATSRPITPRTTSSQSTSPPSSRGLQRLLTRVRTALRRGSLNNRTAIATPPIDHAPVSEVDALPNPLPVSTALQETAQHTVEGASRQPTTSTWYATSISNNDPLPPAPNLETPLAANISDVRHDELLTPNYDNEALLAVDSARPPYDGLPTSNYNFDTLLTVDDDENIPDSIDESVIPLAYLGRAPSGIAEAKARQLFERHGLTYHTSSGAVQEPAAKIRRVERSVRMRVRWTCHACNTVFGQDKFCPGCGHRRCLECERNPRRRVTMPTREEMTQEPDLRIQSSATQFHPSPLPEQPQSHLSGPQTSTMQTHVNFHPPTSHRAEASPWLCTIQIGQPRPHTAVFDDSTTTTSTASTAINPAHKRDCHQCEATTERVDLTECTSCGHQYCILCPLYANHSTHIMHLKRTVPVVERVYRKLRQRVRFHCEQCDTQYTDRNDCASCGHERCDNCPRFPPRKRKSSPDPLAWQALEAKIANRHNPDPPTSNETPLQEEPQHQARL